MVDLYRPRGFVPCTEAHCRRIVTVVVDTTHDTLVITKEEDRQRGHSIDGYEQRPPLEPASDVEFRDVLHDCEQRNRRMG